MKLTVEVGEAELYALVSERDLLEEIQDRDWVVVNLEENKQFGHPVNYTIELRERGNE